MSDLLKLFSPPPFRSSTADRWDEWTFSSLLSSAFQARRFACVGLNLCRAIVRIQKYPMQFRRGSGRRAVRGQVGRYRVTKLASFNM